MIMNSNDYVEYLKKVPIGTVALFKLIILNNEIEFEVTKVDNFKCATRSINKDVWTINDINNYYPYDCIFLDEIGKSSKFDKDMEKLLK